MLQGDSLQAIPNILRKKDSQHKKYTGKYAGCFLNYLRKLYETHKNPFLLKKRKEIGIFA